MATKRWSADKNIRMIHLYRRNACLWDSTNPKYKNRNAREIAYRAIMRSMDMASVKDVIDKIRVLRNTYNNEWLKTKKSTEDRPYVSRIPWLSHLDFIKKNDSHATEHVEDVQNENKYEIYLDEAQVELTGPDDVTVKTEANDEEESKVPEKRPRASAPYVDESDGSSGCSYRRGEARTRRTPPRDDCFDTFGKYVSSMLRMMPKKKALDLQPKIVTLLTSVAFDSVEEHVSQSDETW